MREGVRAGPPRGGRGCLFRAGESRKPGGGPVHGRSRARPDGEGDSPVAVPFFRRPEGLP